MELDFMDKADGSYAQTRGNMSFEAGVQVAQKGMGLPIEMFRDANGQELQATYGVTSSSERLIADQQNT